MNDTVSIVVSSGLISALVTILTLLFALGSYKEKVTSNTSTIEKHDNKISELSDRVSRLEGGVDRDRAHHGNSYVKAKSPLSLTDKGKVVLLDSTGKDYIDSNKQILIQAIKDNNPKTAYDVQELARTVIEQRTNEDSFIPIKDYVYKKGDNLKYIIDVLAIYLRDIALPELGFHISQIPD